ncbi:MAG: protein phosphatase 2C domain-containing protein [Thermoguttaceae bacterium]|jgi:serine/threonine protein phosphatase PrpC
MSQGEKADLPFIGHPEFDLLLRESQAWLAERGEMVVGSGSFKSGQISGAIHSDFGPADQDKVTNQDYVLAWWPSPDEAQPRLRFVVALADGLTTSFRSECASALACWVGVRALVENARAPEPTDLARLAFNEAGLNIGRLADELARDPEASCPEGQFLSTWKYILRKGGLFQTTLTLAWLDQDHFRIAMVGDGGALWRGYRGPRDTSRVTDRVLATCDLDNQQVYALGPAERCVRDFDCWHEEKLNGPFLCAISTDGIGRGHGASPLALLDDLESLGAGDVENPAQRFIERAIQQCPKDFDDNLTLAVIRAE